MKFITFVMYDIAKAGEVAQASDKAAKVPGQKLLALYACMGKPFDGMPPNSIVAISVRDAESSEALAAALYTLALSGATVWSVPVQEMPIGGAVAEEKKYRK